MLEVAVGLAFVALIILCCLDDDDQQGGPNCPSYNIPVTT